MSRPKQASLEAFTEKLRDAMLAQAPDLKHGEIFLPKYLNHKTCRRENNEFGSLEETFKPVVGKLASELGLSVADPKWCNRFQERYVDDAHFCQYPDFTLEDQTGLRTIILELESLDRAQFHLFSDGGVSPEDKHNDNKLWHYYGTLGNHYTKPEWDSGYVAPRYFIFLLILPDRKVDRYPLHDLDKEYRLYNENLRQTISGNPYQFFDKQIKSLARAFLKNENEFYVNNDWKRISWRESQETCELVFITCTVDRLILSKGSNYFVDNKDPFLLGW